MNDHHVCQCKYCGKMMAVDWLHLLPASEPKPCDHQWVGLSSWYAADGLEHASRKCTKCGLYQQW